MPIIGGRWVAPRLAGLAGLARARLVAAETAAETQPALTPVQKFEAATKPAVAPKRRRRTQAEMNAARAAEETKTAEPDTSPSDHADEGTSDSTEGAEDGDAPATLEDLIALGASGAADEDA